MTEEDQRVVDKYLLEGRLSGLDLEEGKRKKLARIHIDIVKEGTNFVTRVKVLQIVVSVFTLIVLIK